MLTHSTRMRSEATVSRAAAGQRAAEKQVRNQLLEQASRTALRHAHGKTDLCGARSGHDGDPMARDRAESTKGLERARCALGHTAAKGKHERASFHAVFAFCMRVG
jgi:hypothetical protein